MVFHLFYKGFRQTGFLRTLVITTRVATHAALREKAIFLLGYKVSPAGPRVPGWGEQQPG